MTTSKSCKIAGCTRPVWFADQGLCREDGIAAAAPAQARQFSRRSLVDEPAAELVGEPGPELVTVAAGETIETAPTPKAPKKGTPKTQGEQS